jgi:hypothetical protein
MPDHTPTKNQCQPAKSLLQGALACCLALCSPLSVAQADEPRPYYFGASQAFTADTNVFKAPPSGSVQRDLISTTGLLAGLDQPMSRSRLVGDIGLNANRYINNRQLNYFGREGKLRLDWESINRLSGDAGLYQKQGLYSAADQALSTERNVVTDTGANLRVRLGLVTRWSVESALAYNKLKHSDAAQSRQNLSQTAGNLGVRLRPSDLWSVRLGVRETHGKYPHALLQANGTDTADKVNRQDIDLSGEWSPSGASQWDARLSRTHQSHSLAGYGSSNLVTGLVGYNWAPTGKTRLRAELARDTSVGAGDYNLNLIGQPNADTQVRNSLLLGAKWNATAKINVDAQYSRSQRKLASTPTVLTDTGFLIVLPSSGRDTTQAFTLSGSYQANRSTQLHCKLSRELRSVQLNESTLLSTNPYNANMGMCQVKFRI